jgi:hypothetical protein
VHRVLVRRPKGKRPLGRPRRRWEDNINMDLQEIGGGHGDFKLNDLYSLPIIVRVVKSRRMRWAGLGRGVWGERGSLWV